MEKLGLETTKVDILNETAKQKTKKKKNKLDKYPGNNKAPEKFERKNRYGVFGDNPLDRMVDLYYNDPKYERPMKDNLFHIEPYNEKFQDTEPHMMSFVNLSKEKPSSSSTKFVNDRLKVEDYEEDYTDDHLRYEEEMRIPKPERKLLISQKQDQKNSDLPGIVNSQKRVDQVQFMQVKRRTDAAQMIQKWYRGHQGRKNFKKELQKRNIRDQEDYGYFEVAEKGVKQFLKERKQKLDDERLKKKAFYDQYQKEELYDDPFKRNFFEQQSDPTNVFNIFKNKQDGKDPFASPEPSFVTMPDTPKENFSKIRKQAIEKYKVDLHEQSSSIKESISGSYIPTQPSKRFSKTKKNSEDDYSNDFESESIQEDIIGGSDDFRRSDKFQSASEIAMSISAEKRKKNYSYKSSIRESIDEDIIEESLANRDLVESVMSVMDTKKKPTEFTSTDSIKEEIAGSGFKNSSARTPRIHESIPEELEGSGYSDDFESGSISKGKDAFKSIPSKVRPQQQPQKYEPSMIETKEDILLRRRLEKKYGLDVPDTAENLIFDMINAKNLYEKSTTGMHMVDKFERMISKYEANLALANEKNLRLQEENRFREEAQKIREDQISSLVALLLSNKSSLDGNDIGKIVDGVEVPEDIKRKIEERKNLHKKSTPRKGKVKKLRFEESRKSDSEESNPEVIKTGGNSNAMAMFKKAPIKRTKPITPRGEGPSLESKLKNQSDSEKIEESSLESIPYSEDFEEESLAASRPKGFLKTKSEITEEIPEEYDEDDDGGYSMTFDEISESIAHSKSLRSKNKPPLKKSKLDSKYSTSKIEEESITEMIEEDHSQSHLSTSSKNLRKSKTGGSQFSKPDFPKHKPKPHDSNRSLLNKLKDTSMNDFIETLSKGIDVQYKEEYDKLVKEFSTSKIDDYIFAEKKRVLDAWKLKEQKDIQKKRMLIEGWIQMSEIVSKMKEEESLGHSSGSIRDLRKAPKLLFSKPDYSKIKGQEQSEASEFDPDDDSEDSFGLRRAKKQLRDFYNHEDQYDSADEDIVDETEIKMRKKAVKKKKITAEKLLEEKEKAIQDGLRQRIVELDEKHAQEMLGEALEMDVKEEIERRFNLMLELDSENLKERKRHELFRQKRLEDSIEDSSLGHSFKPNKKFTDSVETSQKLDKEESTKSIGNKKKGRNSLDRLVVQAQSKDDQIIQDSIQEDAIQEELDAYSNDFDSISASASNIDPKTFKKLEEKAKEIKKEPEEQQTPEMGKKPNKIQEDVKDEDSEIASEIIEDYSDDFDDSVASSKISNNIQDISKKPENKIEEEKSEEVESEKQETPRIGDDPTPPESNSAEDITPVESEREDGSGSSSDMVIKRVPTGKSDDYIPQISDASSCSFDQSILEGSHPSVDWVLDANDFTQNQEKSKTVEEDKKDKEENKTKEEIEEDIDSDYISDFEDFSDASKEGSTPKVGDKEQDKELDIMDDHEKLADIIAEELFKSIDSVGLYDRTKKIVPPRDFSEEDFKDKFPFKKPIQPKTETTMELSTQLEFFEELTSEILNPFNTRRILRAILEPQRRNELEELQKLKSSSPAMQAPSTKENLIPHQLFKTVSDKMIQNYTRSERAAGRDPSPQKLQALEYHNLALYTSFNEIFTNLIPVGLQKNAFSLATKPQAFQNKGGMNPNSFTERDLRKILKRVVKKLTEIVQIPEIGKKRLISKPKGDEEINVEKETKRKNKIKEENLLNMISKEFDEQEKEWTTVEKEKAQVTFDLADRIMEQITEETAKLLGELESKFY